MVEGVEEEVMDVGCRRLERMGFRSSAVCLARLTCRRAEESLLSAVVGVGGGRDASRET
jgi:hypothetical protein